MDIVLATTIEDGVRYQLVAQAIDPSAFGAVESVGQPARVIATKADPERTPTPPNA
jgi:hypothetical protein